MNAVEERRGYWWQCTSDRSHVVSLFSAVAGVRLVRFLYKLATSGWNQKLLCPPCKICSKGEMRITYDFPRQEDRVRLTVQHIVGVTQDVPVYLPMLWETVPEDDTEPWFDFKYVSRSEDRGYQAYGLARPAVFSRSKLAALFDTYRCVVGRGLLPDR